MYVRPSVVVEPDKAAGRDPGEIAMTQLSIGYIITCVISVVGVFLGSYLLLSGHGVSGSDGIPAWVWFGLAGTTGIVLSIAFVYITQYYTAGTWRPVREIAAATLTGLLQRSSPVSPSVSSVLRCQSWLSAARWDYLSSWAV